MAFLLAIFWGSSTPLAAVQSLSDQMPQFLHAAQTTQLRDLHPRALARCMFSCCIFSAAAVGLEPDFGAVGGEGEPLDRSVAHQCTRGTQHALQARFRLGFG